MALKYYCEISWKINYQDRDKGQQARYKAHLYHQLMQDAVLLSDEQVHRLGGMFYKCNKVKYQNYKVIYFK